MEKHTPGPLSTCGCRGAVWSSNVVVFCPLHAAAPEMLEALEALADAYESFYGRYIDDAVRRGDATPDAARLVNNARAIIRKAGLTPCV